MDNVLLLIIFTGFVTFVFFPRKQGAVCFVPCITHLARATYSNRGGSFSLKIF